MIKLYALDIETTSQGKRANEWTDNMPVKLGNIKDLAKIESKKKAVRDEARSKQALHWATGKIVSLAMVNVFDTTDRHVFWGFDEVEILTYACEKMKGCKLIGKSSQTFDFPFIVGRLIANKMTVPAVLRQRSRMFDMDNFFGWSSASGQRGSLAMYSHGLSLDDKLMDGASVPVLYSNAIDAKIKGDTQEVMRIWDKIAEYNLDDCDKVAHAARYYYGSIEEVN